MQRCENVERQYEPSRSVILPVTRPRDHDGVGRALRDVYLPHAADLPDGMAALLDKLV